jgi:hypothetical protein
MFNPIHDENKLNYPTMVYRFTQNRLQKPDFETVLKTAVPHKPLYITKTSKLHQGISGNIDGGEVIYI